MKCLFWRSVLNLYSDEIFILEVCLNLYSDEIFILEVYFKPLQR